MQDTAIALGCSPEHDGKILLLKTPHTLVTEHGEIKSAFLRKPPTCWLVFTGLEHAMEAAWGGVSSTVLPSFESCDAKNMTIVARQEHRCNLV